MPCYCYRMEGMCGPCKTALRAEGRIPDDRVALPDPNGPWALADQDRADALAEARSEAESDEEGEDA